MKTTLITVRVKMLSAGGVASPENRDDVDNILPLRRDPTGRIHLPGTSIAGNLRHYCANVAVLSGLFGSRPGEDASVSTVQVQAAVIRSVVKPQVTAGTAINRRRAAAERSTLRSIEQLPAGTEFDVFLRWDDAVDATLAEFLAALPGWRPRLGHAISTGAGRCQVIGVGHRAYDLSSTEGLLGWLTLDGPDAHPEPLPLDASDDPSVVVAVDEWLEIVDGLHIGTEKSTEDSDEQQKINRVLKVGDDCLVPGATLKGVLRSRCEYICRVLGADACADGRCGQCRPCRIFGHSGETSRRAAVAVHDAVISNPVTERRTHVAIDRFTGGARDSLLYTDEVVVVGEFRLLIEELDPLDEAERALVNAAVTDIHDGLVGIGARTTSGQGTVRIRDDSWRRPRLTDLATLLTAGQIA